jgi:very-short-patch-repair endonuclease
MKPLPPQAPPDPEGEQKSPRLSKEGVGGGCHDCNHIHNKTILKSRRKNLRNEATPTERKLWSALQNSQLNGYKFRRQHSVGYYILDFYCPAERLAIELDGDSHFSEEAIAYDRERTSFLNSHNVRVLRFLNSDVFDNLDGVCSRILAELERIKI